MEDGSPGDMEKGEKKKELKAPELEDVEQVMGDAQDADSMDGDTVEIVPEEEPIEDQEEPSVEELFPEDEDSDVL